MSDESNSDTRILVIDKARFDTTPDQRYRAMLISGAVYTEDQYRRWVNDTWTVDIHAPLHNLAKVALKGGWLCFRLLT